MELDATQDQIDVVVRRIKAVPGLDCQIIIGKERTILLVLGTDVAKKIDPQPIRVFEGVMTVTLVGTPFKLASRAFHHDDTIVDAGGIKIGGNQIVVMAGPCAVESRDQVRRCAEVVRSAGGTILRGGAFKPRTTPYSFQGLGEQGLQFLREAADEFGLKVVTEVMGTEFLDLVAQYADILQIGARNGQNFELLKAICDRGMPVLLKRGAGCDIVKEWLCAAEYLLCGNHGTQVILCERGIKTFETVTRSTLDLSAIPVVKRLSHLPVIVDPSHAPGDWHYVPALAKAAIAVGADGLEVEIHPDPKNALCDGAQALTFSDFTRLMGELRAIASAVGRSI